MGAVCHLQSSKPLSRSAPGGRTRVRKSFSLSESNTYIYNTGAEVIMKIRSVQKQYFLTVGVLCITVYADIAIH